MIKKLEDFRAYQLAMSVGDEIWEIVLRWNYFQSDTVGKQLVKAADSVAANLSEGLGRYHFKDIKNFGYFSRGSLFETKTWLVKSYNRKLINQRDFQQLTAKLDSIGRMVNAYIKSVGIVEKQGPIRPKP